MSDTKPLEVQPSKEESAAAEEIVKSQFRWADIAAQVIARHTRHNNKTAAQLAGELADVTAEFQDAARQYAQSVIRHQKLGTELIQERDAALTGLEKAKEIIRRFVPFEELADNCEIKELLKKTMTGAELIAKERQRQINKEGWTPEHDDKHTHGELLAAGICYAMPPKVRKIRLNFMQDLQSHFWPWDPEWWKPTKDPARNLVKAGALIAAEIDRLQRAAAKLKETQL